MIGLGFMHGVCVDAGLPSYSWHPKLVSRVRIKCSTKVEVSSCRLQLLENVDKELIEGDDRAALALVKDLQGNPNGLRCFGAARQVGYPNSPIVSPDLWFASLVVCMNECAGSSKALHIG